MATCRVIPVLRMGSFLSPWLHFSCTSHKGVLLSPGFFCCVQWVSAVFSNGDGGAAAGGDGDDEDDGDEEDNGSFPVHDKE